MKHFGIIGYPLHHSFSANYFNEKFCREGIEAEYTLYPLERIEEFDGLPLAKQLSGLNVTMPYKQAVIPYLTALDDTARKIGAVNVIKVCSDGQMVGYNTDAIGFIESIRPNLLPTDKHALILGTGGASRAVKYGLEKLGLTCTKVSRTPAPGQIGYADICLDDYTVVVNCTPLGMVPNVDAMPPIPYDQLTSAHFLYDCIYNPEETLFLHEARLRGCRTQNGTEMLYGQARAAWAIWTEEKR